ncbi:MAG: vitamin K epoxide reductase family protein, partial [bacterium]|nr:vitamin K epoxide reductase family protein [bacterium]
MENSLNKKAVTAILLAGILGVLVSVVLTKQHYAVSQKGFQEKSFCSISEFIDCDVAMVSPYAKIFGIPTSELSLLFYLFVTLSAGYLLVSKKEKILPFLLGLSLAGLFYSAFMAFVSFFRLKVLCLFCATLYLDILLLVVFLFWALKLSPWKAPLFFARYLAATFKKGEEGNHLGIHLLSIGLLFGIGLLFFVGLNQNIHSRPRPFSKALFQRAYLSQTEENFALPEGRPFWGDPNSSVTIVEFSDFQCPFCRVAAFSVKPFLGEYRDKVRLVSLQYPLDKSCNPNIEHDFHRLSCLAAKAALCAQDQGKYWDYFEEVFE